MNTWTLSEANQNFTTLTAQAATAPQIITKDDKNIGVYFHRDSLQALVNLGLGKTDSSIHELLNLLQLINILEPVELDMEMLEQERYRERPNPILELSDESLYL